MSIAAVHHHESARTAMLACPACAQPCDARPSHTYTIEEAAAHFCPAMRDPHRYERLVKCIQRLWGRNECHVFHCRNCGFGFADPYVAGDEEFYGILHEQHGYPGWRWDYDVAVEQALKGKTAGAILDVGAGTGAFLRSLPSGWGKYAVEGSPTTRQILTTDRIEVFPNLEEAVRGGVVFDVITMFQVLEHLAPFADTLEHCRKLLRPGGAFVVTVPDAEAMERQEQLTGCADMPPNHVNKWTPQSLSLVLSKAGFVAGEPIFQPASLATVRSTAHLRILAQRRKQGSLAERVYRVQSRSVRAMLLAIVAGPALLSIAPHLPRLWRGSAFAIVAR